MTLEIDGLVKHILPPQGGTSTRTGKEWKSQDFVIETMGAYPSFIAFSMFNDKITPLTPDQRVRVSFEPRSRHHNGRWYTTLTAYKIETIGAAAGVVSPPPPPPQVQQAPPPSTLPPLSSQGEELPF